MPRGREAGGGAARRVGRSAAAVMLAAARRAPAGRERLERQRREQGAEEAPAPEAEGRWWAGWDAGRLEEEASRSFFEAGAVRVRGVAGAGRADEPVRAAVRGDCRGGVAEGGGRGAVGVAADGRLWRWSREDVGVVERRLGVALNC